MQDTCPEDAQQLELAPAVFLLSREGEGAEKGDALVFLREEGGISEEVGTTMTEPGALPKETVSDGSGWVPVDSGKETTDA